MLLAANEKIDLGSNLKYPPPEIGKFIDLIFIVERGNSKIELSFFNRTFLISVGQSLIPYLLCLIGKILESYLKPSSLKISKAHKKNSCESTCLNL